MNEPILWQLELRAIKDLKPLDINPRRMTKEQFKQLDASIAKFGYIDKLVINLDNGIICGHQRLQVLKKQKVKDILCWIPNRMLTQDEVHELCVRSNKNTGEWDWEILANSYEIADLVTWGFDAAQLFDEIGSEIEDNVKNAKAKKAAICPKCGEEFIP